MRHFVLLLTLLSAIQIRQGPRHRDLLISAGSLRPHHRIAAQRPCERLRVITDEALGTSAIYKMLQILDRQDATSHGHRNGSQR
jgi:hypothetical protein